MKADLIEVIRDRETAYSSVEEDESREYYYEILGKNINFVRYLVNRYSLLNKKVLDYGCGIGQFTQLFHIHGCIAEGSDFNKEQLEKATRYSDRNIKYFMDDFFNSNLSSEYDFIWCRNLGPLMCIEYDGTLKTILKKITTHIKPNGAAYFTLMDDLNGKRNPFDGSSMGGFVNATLRDKYNMFSQLGLICCIYIYMKALGFTMLKISLY